jgi:ABC-2 type transport system permease protein
MLKLINKNLSIFIYFFRNELKTIFKDAGAVLLFMVALVIYPLLYSVAYQKEVIRDIPVAVVDLDHTALSRQASRMADASEQLLVAYKPVSLIEAKNLFFNGKIKGVYAGSVYSIGTLSAGIEIKRFLAEGNSIKQSFDQQDPLKVQSRYLYNPAGGYGSFVLPGIVVLILQQTMLIGIGMLGGTSREHNFFHIIHEQVNEKWGSIPIILGKSFAYVFIYLFNVLFTMVILHKWLNLPDNSNFISILFLTIPFLFATAFLGLAISVFFRERVYSLLFMVFLSPVVLFLSGLSWPASAIPKGLYAVAHIFPSTTMIPAYIRIRISGASINQVSGEWIFLLIQMLVYFILACVSYKIAMKKFTNPTINVN